jgi:hypothetical protein
VKEGGIPQAKITDYPKSLSFWEGLYQWFYIISNKYNT